MLKKLGFWDLERHLDRYCPEGRPVGAYGRDGGFCAFPTEFSRMPLNAVLKFKMLAPQSLCGPPLDATKAMACDRTTWLRFHGFYLNDTVPDANTLRDFREALIEAGAFEGQLQESGGRTGLPSVRLGSACRRRSRNRSEFCMEDPEIRAVSGRV